MNIQINDIFKSREVKAFLEASSIQMNILGYTEHSFRHCRLVSNKCGEILELLGYSSNDITLGRIAGYLHDIGNAVNRKSHPETGALLSYDLLVRKGLEYHHAVSVMMAIANHDEEVGIPVNPISAALILSDKADVHRSRVTNTSRETFDIHDRVNYAATKSTLVIDPIAKTALLEIEIDTEISSIMDYFEIFLKRMKMCRNAADYLSLRFLLTINGMLLI
jgi:uncharacterized protein